MRFLWGNPFRKDKELEAVNKALKNCYLFEQFTDKELLALRNRIHVRKYNVGDDVYEQNQPGTGLYIVVSGKVAIEEAHVFMDSKTNTEKKEIVVQNTLVAKDFFGETALVDDEHIRPASARIVEPAIVIGFFKPDFMDMIKQYPQAGIKLCMRLAMVATERLKDAVEDIKNMRA